MYIKFLEYMNCLKEGGRALDVNSLNIDDKMKKLYRKAWIWRAGNSDAVIGIFN